jgi:FtsH-binding integral membrane protein
VIRVYSIVSLQLFVTSCVVALAIFNQAFAEFQIRHTGVFWLCLIVSIISLIALSIIIS